MVRTGLPRLPFLPFLTRVFTLVSTRVLISEDTTPAQVLWEDFPTLMQRLDTLALHFYSITDQSLSRAEIRSQRLLTCSFLC